MINCKKSILLSSILLLMFPITNAIAFTHIDNVKNGHYVFFLVDLEVGENIELNVTHEESGNFTLFLFNKRPSRTYVHSDNTLSDTVFSDSAAYSLDDNPYINYTASEERIYYIEVILVSGGPDTFTLTSSKELSRYYLPQIPGYDLYLILISLLLVSSTMIILIKRNLRIINV